ncbi:hypothetical protein [Nocardia wallacei]|uniref:hypothetical protein n=1 Tax=Nocardia wallacei TaxID=480035 RepID=UPI002458F654|nr:hypothetical protein [Nocardia wallacei]
MPVRFELRGVEYPGQPRSIWQFGEPDCPLRLAEAPKGVGGAPIVHVRQANARQAGATWRGSNRDINLITLTVRLGPVEPGEVALDLWNTWRDSLGDGQALAEFHVISPGGGDRFQYVRRENQIPDPSFDLLNDVGWCTETAVLGSDESWWNGATVNPPTYTPDTFAGRTIHNDGDVAAWVFYKLTGPGRYSIGVDGETQTLPTIPAGETWTVETNPEYPHIHNGAGLDVWEQAGNVGWYKSVPAKSTVALNISGTATSEASRIEVWMPQKYERAAA